jgi:hypothetical protein
VLLPAFGRARGKQAESVCLSNLAQLGGAMLGYANEHGGIAPLDDSEHNWNLLIFPYVDDESIFECPADELDYFQDFGTSYKWRNDSAVDPAYPERSIGGVDLLTLEEPELVIIAFDAGEGWHEQGRINAATADGSASPFTLDDFDENLMRQPQ